MSKDRNLPSRPDISTDSEMHEHLPDALDAIVLDIAQAVHDQKTAIVHEGDHDETREKRFNAAHALSVIQKAKGLLEKCRSMGATLPESGEDEECHALFGTTKNGQRAIILGENHGDPLGLSELEEVVKRIANVSQDNIVFYTEESVPTSLKLDDVERLINTGKLELNGLPSAVLATEEIGETLGIERVYPVTSTNNPKVFERAAELLSNQIPNVKSVDLMANELLGILCNVLRNIDQTQLNALWPKYLQRLTSHFSKIWDVKEGDLLRAVHDDKMIENLRADSGNREHAYRTTISGAAIAQSFDELTTQNIAAAIERHPTKLIVCVAGCNHVDSIRKGMGFVAQ